MQRYVTITLMVDVNSDSAAETVTRELIRVAQTAWAAQEDVELKPYLGWPQITGISTSFESMDTTVHSGQG